MQSVANYTDAVQASVQSAQQTGQLNSTSLAVLQAAKGVPGAAQAYQLAQTLQSGIGSVFGQGSTLARAAAAGLSTGNVLTTLPAVIKTVFGGRTYGSDNYWGAVFYQYYVLGKANIRQINQVGDGDVGPALQWFVNKTGVFISGREHIKALQKSAQDYINLHNVNPDTTTDINRVNAAVRVVQTYMPVDNIGVVPAGAWANTVGVYDQVLVNAITGQAQIVAGSPLSALTNPPPSLENQQVTPVPLQLKSGGTVPAGTAVTVIPGSPGQYIIPGLLIAAAIVLVVMMTYTLTPD